MRRGGSIRGFRGSSRGGSASSNSSSRPTTSNSTLTPSSSSSAPGRPSIQPSSNPHKSNPALLALGSTSGGIGGTWGKARDLTGRISTFSSESDKCPICHNDRFLNPKLKLMVSTCYHIMCTTCIDRLFSQGPGNCPSPGCGNTCRKNDFGDQTFEDLNVEKEVDIRRRVGKVFYKKQEDFIESKDWNDYLEMVEEITSNLIHDLEPESTLQRIESYKASLKPTQTSFLPTSHQPSSNSNSTSESQAYQLEILENHQRKARAQRDLERKERDSKLKREEETQILKGLENGDSNDQTTKLKEKFNEMRQKNEEKDQMEDEEVEKLEKLRMRTENVKRKNGKNSKIGVDGIENGRPWSISMIQDFKGPLAILEERDWLWKEDLKITSNALYGNSNGGGGKEGTITEKLWLNPLVWEKDYGMRARAGGFDYGNWWSRGGREATETLGIGKLEEGMELDL